jgi:hypothetical protein
MTDIRYAIARHFPPLETLVWFVNWIIPGAPCVQTSFCAGRATHFCADRATQGDPRAVISKTDSNLWLNVASEFTNSLG